MKYTPNKIKVDLGSYRHYWRGVKKIGKTTLFRDLVKYAYGDYKYGFLIAPGNETGFKALDGIYAMEAPTWRNFVEIIDDLVENKQDNEFKLVAIDTVDELVSIAGDQVLKIHFQRKGERALTINAALGGFGAGPKMVQDLINDQIKRIEGAGYGLVFIGHTKIRDIKEKNMEEGYQQLTSNLESRYDSIFSDKADIIATLYISRNVKNNALAGTERFVYFRNDGFVDAGTRFSNMPESVPMTPQAYLDAFEQGVKSSFAKESSQAEIDTIRKNEVEARENSSKTYIQLEKVKNELPTPEEYRSQIDAKLAELDKETKNQKRAEVKESGLPTNIKEITDIELLKKILKIVSE
jgi:hypothetical protein